MKYHGIGLGAPLLATVCAQAQAAPLQCSGMQHVDAVTRAYLPRGFVQVQSRVVQTNGRATQLRRYQAQEQSQPRLGGAHFSTLANAGGCVIGFIRLTPNLVTRESLTQEEALTIARRFLRIHVPDLLADHTALGQDVQRGFSGRRPETCGARPEGENAQPHRWRLVLACGGRRQAGDVVWTRPAVVQLAVCAHNRALAL